MILAEMPELERPHHFEDAVIIREVREDDQVWVLKLLGEHWGGPTVVSRGQLHEPAKSPGFVAEREGQPVGLVTFHVAGTECQVLTLNSTSPRTGIGTTLLVRLERRARELGCERLWLITTNDNTDALQFYQRRGFDLIAIHHDALDASRRLKPQIPHVGKNGIPMQHEMELEKDLNAP